MSTMDNLVEKINFYIQGDDGLHCKAIMEPLDRGSGATTGNHLRRVLLSRVNGAAVYAIQIDGISHQYESMYGVKEDVVNIVLNLKHLVIQMNAADRKIMKLSVQGPCVVKAGMITHDDDISIINPDMTICTITSDIKFNMTLYCARGVGYESEAQSREKLLTSHNSSVMPIDAIYSPVKLVSYTVENTRVGQRTDYDKLILDIETNGAVSPTDAISEAGTILSQLFALCVKQTQVSIAEDSVESNPHLRIRVEDTPLSTRIKNCLKSVNIVFIGDLVVKTEAEIRGLSSFGDKSVDETHEYLKSLNLSLGMTT